MPVYEIADEHHFTHNSKGIQDYKRVVSKSCSQWVVFKQVVKVAVAISQGPDYSYSGESQIVRSGLGKCPGYNQSAQNLEECP